MYQYFGNKVRRIIFWNFGNLHTRQRRVKKALLFNTRTFHPFLLKQIHGLLGPKFCTYLNKMPHHAIMFCVTYVHTLPKSSSSVPQKAVINCCYFKKTVILTQNYPVLKITTINNSFCPSYTSYLAKSAPLKVHVSARQTKHVKQSTSLPVASPNMYRF